MLILLRLEALHQVLYFSVAGLPAQRNKEIGPAKIAVVLWNLVLEDQMASPSIPSQFIDHPMILVQVVAGVSQNQIRRTVFLQGLEILLYLQALEWEEASSEIRNLNILFRRTFQE